MYSVYKELHAPTGVELSCYCYFFDRREKNLVVAGCDYLKVFRFVPDPAEEVRDETQPPRMRMECMATYRLYGTIMAMESMPLSLARDALLLAIADAKLTIVEYDPEVHDLRTISMHYFETDDLKGGSISKPQCILRVDPEDRCAALLIYNRQLVIIPFMRRDAMFDDTLTEQPEIKPNVASLSRIPALRSYTVDLRELDTKIDNVVDFKFLHGYYEPTLVFVYEPIKTYVGRLAARLDTCALTAVSLNISQKVHPCIWTVTHLPYDCCAVYAVPKPIGGVLVMAQNSLLYLNQSIPPYCAALNSIAAKSTNFPMKPQEEVAITLDCAQADFLSPNQMIISLKGGDLFVLTLLCDTMRSVRGFHLEKGASSVLTTCLLICDKDYIFLGSRVGNSLLLRLIDKGYIKEVNQESEASSNGIENNEDEMDVSAYDGEDDSILKVKRSRLALDKEEVDVYGAERRTHFVVRVYGFDVCDSILNIGPCGNMVMGEPSSEFASLEFADMEDPDLEIVTTSGVGKNGALCVLQRSVRPQILQTLSIPGLKNFWTLFDSPSTSLHRIVLISQESRTLVAETDKDLNQISSNGFRTEVPTIFACNFGKNKYIVQVLADEVQLLEGTQLVQQIILDLDSSIISASVADPYLCLLSEDGRVVILTLNESDQLEVSNTQMHKKGKVSAICTYRDTSGLFTAHIQTEETPEEQIVRLAKLKKEARNEEELLYGNPDFADSSFKKQQTATTSRWWRTNRTRPSNENPSFWLVIARCTGELEILSLPDLRSKMTVIDFALAPKILGHTSQRGVKEGEAIPEVHEILLVGLGYNGRRPMLFSRIGDDVLIYEVYPFYEDTYENVLKLRFAKVKHHLILRERKSARRDSTKESFSLSLKTHFRSFEYLGGYSGVFICGPYPHWAFLTMLGQLRLHPMGIDSKVVAFGTFNSPDYPQGGYIYANADSDFRICVLLKHLNHTYDSTWPVRKIPVRCTAHFIAYHLESKTYCVALSEAESSARICRVAGDEKEFIDEQKDERFPLPQRLKFSLNIYSPSTWEVVPNTKQEMDAFESILCLKVVNLAYEGSRSGLRGYVAVGTNYSYGEDTTSRGRIMVLDIIDVVPEPGQPLTKNKFKTLYTKEHKGPVTAVESVVGFLCAAVGQKLYLWQLKDNDLVGIAFIDTQIYVHQMQSVKNLILIADVYKSISLLRFQENYRTLAVVSRDFRPLEVYGISFLIDNTQLGLLATDRDKNIILYMFQPQSKESFGGQRLVRKADFHVGQQILSFGRVRCKVIDPSTTKRNSVAIEKRVVTFFCTLDGGLGFLLPISERVYRRLLMLQSVLTNILPHRASLNPKAYRTLYTIDRTLGNPVKSIIDGELAWEFMGLSFTDKNEVSKKIGCTNDEIIEDLMEIDRITAHF